MKSNPLLINKMLLETTMRTIMIRRGLLFACTVVLLMALICPAILTAQEKPKSDSTIVFQSPRPLGEKKEEEATMKNAWGLDIFVSDNGFGGGAFYRREFTEELFGFVSFGISEAKGDNEFEYVDYWGNSFVQGKVNRLIMIPVMAGVQYRLFKDEIADNFRPYINAGIGPTMIFASPYVDSVEVAAGLYVPSKVEFFSSLKYGQAHYTVGGFVGIGANFGFDKSSLLGVNLRYYVIPFPNGIESTEGQLKKQFGGFYITLNFGIVY